MNVEQRLITALRAADRVEPSPDLWSRVLHSIEEDHAHRRRIWTSVAATLATTAVLVVVGVLALSDHRGVRQVRLPAMELIETIALVALVVVLGPAIRRFGRNYAADLWRSRPEMATALVRLLDIAYALVFTGYILLTAELDFGASQVYLAEQVGGAVYRIAGLLVVMGVLHAATIMALPAVALVANSTVAGRRLPRWFVFLLVAVGLGLAPFAVPAIGGVISIAVR